MKVGTTFKCADCGQETVAYYTQQEVCKPCLGVRRIRVKEEMESSYFTIFHRDGFKCVYCGKSSIEDGVKLVIDHIDPYCKSQNNSIYNLITACNECNLKKASIVLNKDVYERVVRLAIKRNGGISPEKQEEVNRVFDKYFKLTKEGVIS